MSVMLSIGAIFVLKKKLLTTFFSPGLDLYTFRILEMLLLGDAELDRITLQYSFI